MFNNQNLGVQDSIIFTAVTSPIAKTAYHGYKKFTVDELSNGIENNYTIKYYHFNNDNLYLQSEVRSLKLKKQQILQSMKSLKQHCLTMVVLL